MKIYLLLACFFLCLPGLLQAKEKTGQKTIIGATAFMEVGGVPFPMLARIDTGAHNTSIHALNVHVVNESDEPDENIGKTVTFTTTDRKGKSVNMAALIVRVSRVTNSQGTEKRYVVELPVSWHHISKKVQVNLRDRSKMKYKLLIGRNWLSGDFLVDVDLNAEKN